MTSWFIYFTVLQIISRCFADDGNVTGTSSTWQLETNEEKSETQHVTNRSGIQSGEKGNFDDNFWVLGNDSTKADDISDSDPISESTLEHDTTLKPEPTTVQIEVNTPVRKEDQIALDDSATMQHKINMDEEMFLYRNNCNLEIQVKEWEDMKLRIVFEKLRRGMVGQCQITLQAKAGVFLAVIITDVELRNKKRGYERNAPNERLRLITRTNGFNFTVKEYLQGETFYPVMLCDSNRVFLILSFNATDSYTTSSGFNLEVFNYYKNENKLEMNDKISQGYYDNSNKNIDDIYITTVAP